MILLGLNGIWVGLDGMDSYGMVDKGRLERFGSLKCFEKSLKNQNLVTRRGC